MSPLTHDEVSGVVTTYTREGEFTNALNVSPDVATDIWNAMEPGTTVILEVNKTQKVDLCGRDIVAKDREHHIIVAEIIQRRERAVLLDDGACLRNYHALCSKLERNRRKLEAARSGEIGDDPNELKRVVEILSRRVQTRAGLTSYFYNEWVPKQAILDGYARSPVPTRQDVDDTEAVEASQ